MSRRVLPRSVAALVWLLGLTAAPPPALPLDVGGQERFDWPGCGETRLSIRDGDVLALARWSAAEPAGMDHAGPIQAGQTQAAAGFSCPYLVAGPVLGRGLFRLAADPLGYTAWSIAFREPTALVLDSSLRSSRQGVLLSPLPGRSGLFARERGEETDRGAFARVPLGAGVEAEGLLVASQPGASLPADEWLPDTSPFPGGGMTHAAGRLLIQSSRFDFSFATIGSSAQWAAPGATASLWARGKAPAVEGSLLLAAASSPYRTPDGESLAGRWEVSACTRLGRDPEVGEVQVGGAFVAEQPAFAPRREVPCRTVLRIDLSRDFVPAEGVPLSVLLQADKEIRRNSEGESQARSRCGGTICVEPRGFAVRAGAGISDVEGTDLLGGLSFAPRARVRSGVEVTLSRLGQSRPVGSLDFLLVVGEEQGQAALRLGVKDYPVLARALPGPGAFLRITLSTVIRSSIRPAGVSPILPPG